jgi:hypothetical protein
MGTVQKKKAVVFRHGRALIQMVYYRQHPTHTERWVWVGRNQYPVRPHPNGRGYEVIENLPCQTFS